MDIFSAGCALLELWTDGAVPFNYSQLLAYRNGNNDVVSKHMSTLDNAELRQLIMSMISIDPKDRKAAEIYLSEQRGVFFPEYFYSFLQSFIQMFSTKSADDKISALRPEIEQIVEILLERDTDSSENGTILLTSIVTSCIRGIGRSKSKLQALDIIQILAHNSSSEIILDRMLPYILHLTTDEIPKIRVHALDTLTVCVKLIKSLPRSDMNIFTEYILPSISHLAGDKAVTVRVAYAKNISILAEAALNFLKQVQIDFPAEISAQRYEMELFALHETLQQAIMSLLTDSQSIVKQTLVQSKIVNLCMFFGRQKANDVILSHMITFLNDKEDKNLRGAFFDCIIDVANFVGWHCSPILIPLLEQGLTDPEEFITAKALRATTILIDMGLLQKTALTDYIKECSCYLNHPNIWIRHEVCGLISVAAKRLSPLDVQCKVMPSIVNHLRAPLIQVDNTELLLDSLQAPLPRHIFDTVLRFPEIQTFFNVLLERKAAREKNSKITGSEKTSSIATVSLVLIFNQFDLPFFME